MTRNFRISLLLAALLAVTACGDKDDKGIKPPESDTQLYREALAKYNTEDYKAAAKGFDEIDRQHPASAWAVRGQIMSAYSSYQAEDYDTALATLNNFVRLYPNDTATPYAYYLIALCYYDQISDVGRDQKMTQDAMQALREVIRRFPDSEYARDARIKLDLTTDHMAGKEMQVGRYYEKHDDYIAAINRYRVVVENYQTTSHVPEALYRLVECYLELGVRQEAQRYAAVLGYNFPNNVWYRDAYKLMTGKEAPAPAAAQNSSDDHSSWWDHLIP